MSEANFRDVPLAEKGEALQRAEDGLIFLICDGEIQKRPRKRTAAILGDIKQAKRVGCFVRITDAPGRSGRYRVDDAGWDKKASSCDSPSERRRRVH